jgi:hypothetical protein
LPAVKRLVLIGLVALCVSACGSAGGATTYTKAATAACLRAVPNVQVGAAPASDFVANSATGGSIGAKLIDNRVTISFGLTFTDANNIDDAYRRFRAKNVGIEDVLRTQQNAVMLWHEHPSDVDLGIVTGCLKGS